MTAAATGGPLWLVGCGNMGGAMLGRWLADGVAPERVTVITRTEREVPPAVRHLTALPADETADTIVLAVKPQQIDDVAPAVARAKPRLLLSILAGVEVDALAARFPDATIVRAMPNLPVAIGEGVTALYAAGAGQDERAEVDRLIAPLGLAQWVDDEAQFAAVTALAGCGPGFVFRFADALARAGEALGLDEVTARRLALATLAGSATMALDADATPADLADRVASKGGSTREGLNVLDHDEALVSLMKATLAASARRNAEMAAAARR